MYTTPVHLCMLLSLSLVACCDIWNVKKHHIKFKFEKFFASIKQALLARFSLNFVLFDTFKKPKITWIILKLFPYILVLKFCVTKHWNCDKEENTVWKIQIGGTNESQVIHWRWNIKIFDCVSSKNTQTKLEDKQFLIHFFSG